MFKRQYQRIAAAMMALFAFCAVTLPASAQVTLPDAGVDTAGHITAVITALGAVIAVAVGGFFAFLVIRKGLRWARSIL